MYACTVKEVTWGVWRHASPERFIQDTPSVLETLLRGRQQLTRLIILLVELNLIAFLYRYQSKNPQLHFVYSV